MTLAAILTIALGYLLGGIPSAYIMGRLVKGIDIREVGDGNMGAANTFREIGPLAGVVVAIADVAKGAIAVFIARWAAVPEAIVLLTGLAAVAGHNWPIFLQLRGGRGESTTIGILSTLMPGEMAVLLGPAGVALLVTHSVVKASVILFVPLPLVAWWVGASGLLIVYSIALPSLVGLTHFLRTRAIPRGSAIHITNEKLHHPN